MSRTLDNEAFARHVQAALTGRGYPLALDGHAGAKTRAAFDAFMASLPGAAAVPAPALRPSWVEEGLKVFGWHEVRDNARLRAWLRSDGKTLGDPAALPWCGDFTETCIKLALPGEPFPGALGINPYWARNWALFGRDVSPVYGAVLVFSRGSGGHVGFAVGQDAECFHVLGGNQGDAVSVVRIDRRRLIACRWPVTASGSPQPLPDRPAGNLPKSTNEV
jgi:uncharacterized protein (TIGR02594 family)